MLVTSWRQSFRMQLHRHVPYLCSAVLSQLLHGPELHMVIAQLGPGQAFVPRLPSHS